jgi:AcrR family transcriptional regulator
MESTTGHSGLSGKQREILERDERFLQLARTIFLEEGYHAVTIGRIARMTGFSKGTVYQRFTGKEQLMVELAIRCRAELVEVMDLARRIAGCARERMVAIGEAIEIYARLYSDNMRIMAVIDEETVRDKVPQEQQERLHEQDLRLFGVLAELVEEAIRVGDLELPPKCSVQSICLSLWALLDGWAHAVRGAVPLEDLGLNAAPVDILRSARYLMDGYNWRPLRGELPYDRVRERVVEALGSEHDLHGIGGVVTGRPEA